MRCLCIAHRGLYQNTQDRCNDDDFTENSVPAFKRAHELGYGGIEFDVQMTRDKELVLWHDDKIMYECVDGSIKSVAVCDVTYRDLLDIIENCVVLRCDEGREEHYVWMNAPHFIPTLEMIVDVGLQSFVKSSDFIVNIEVKIPTSEASNKGFIATICDKVVERICDVSEYKIVLSSFNLIACVELKKRLSASQNSQNSQSSLVMFLVDTGDLENALCFAKSNNLDGIVAHVSLFGGSEDFRIMRPDFLDVWCYDGEFAGAAYCIVDHSEKNRA